MDEKEMDRIEKEMEALESSNPILKLFGLHRILLKSLLERVNTIESILENKGMM